MELKEKTDSLFHLVKDWVASLNVNGVSASVVDTMRIRVEGLKDLAIKPPMFRPGTLRHSVVLVDLLGNLLNTVARAVASRVVVIVVSRVIIVSRVVVVVVVSISIVIISLGALRASRVVVIVSGLVIVSISIVVISLGALRASLALSLACGSLVIFRYTIEELYKRML